jgi:hypothetical protein
MGLQIRNGSGEGAPSGGSGGTYPECSCYSRTWTIRTKQVGKSYYRITEARKTRKHGKRLACDGVRSPSGSIWAGRITEARETRNHGERPCMRRGLVAWARRDSTIVEADRRGSLAAGHVQPTANSQRAVPYVRAFRVPELFHVPGGALCVLPCLPCHLVLRRDRSRSTLPSRDPAYPARRARVPSQRLK